MIKPRQTAVVRASLAIETIMIGRPGVRAIYALENQQQSVQKRIVIKFFRNFHYKGPGLKLLFADRLPHGDCFPVTG